MSVTLIPAGGLKAYAGDREQVELDSGPTVEELLERAGIEAALVAAVIGENDELVTLDYRPQDGERLKLIAVMGGG